MVIVYEYIQINIEKYMNIMIQLNIKGMTNLPVLHFIRSPASYLVMIIL